MPQWSFGRKVLAAYLTLAMLLASMAVASILSIHSLWDGEQESLRQWFESREAATELRLQHEIRLSETRAYLISNEQSHLSAANRAKVAFRRLLEQISDRAKGTPDQELVNRIDQTETAYNRILQKAVTNPKRTAWLMDSLARPLRLNLESLLSNLDEKARSRTVYLRNENERRVKASTQRLMWLAIGKGLAVLLMGWLLWRILREEGRKTKKTTESAATLLNAERRAALLAQTGKTVAESADPKLALSKVADLSVEWLSTGCLIELTEGGSLRPIALALGRSEREVLLRTLHKSLPQGLGALFSTSEILQSGRTLLVESVSDQKLTALGIKTFMAVPLRARSRALGVLLVFRTDYEAAYTYNDLQFVRELSSQTALAIENSRLLIEAEEGVRMREELLSTVAHDLKNPLTSIRMNSELLLKSGSPSGSMSGDDRTALVSARAIQESTDSMERLIHDLLDLTKLESGRVELDLRPCDAADLIDACLKEMTMQAQVREIELIKDVRPGESIAQCDRGRVTQILSNLVGNAIKYTGQGGRVRVEATPTGEGIRFSVVDNGPGISAEDLPRIFDRYWQARRTQKGSAGLGLSIARSIVEAHGGRIWVESALKIGTRFFFTLPEARKARLSKIA